MSPPKTNGWIPKMMGWKRLLALRKAVVGIYMLDFWGLILQKKSWGQQLEMKLTPINCFWFSKETPAPPIAVEIFGEYPAKKNIRDFSSPGDREFSAKTQHPWKLKHCFMFTLIFGEMVPIRLKCIYFQKKTGWNNFLGGFVFRKISSQTQELQIEVSRVLLGACISACDANIWWRGHVYGRWLSSRWLARIGMLTGSVTRRINGLFHLLIWSILRLETLLIWVGRFKHFYFHPD